ncbi:MAG TPA: hypothetical protein VHO84_14835 [Syntrophorhabdaceae bacterium]|nr:hypothetical protein [Syntrophorhabdaceae bacterium]
MNRDIIQGKWEEIKGAIREIRGKLTHNSTAEMNGKEERRIGKLKKMYGYLAHVEQEYEELCLPAEKENCIRAMIKQKLGGVS